MGKTTIETEITPKQAPSPEFIQGIRDNSNPTLKTLQKIQAEIRTDIDNLLYNEIIEHINNNESPTTLTITDLSGRLVKLTMESEYQTSSWWSESSIIHAITSFFQSIFSCHSNHLDDWWKRLLTPQPKREEDTEMVLVASTKETPPYTDEEIRALESSVNESMGVTPIPIRGTPTGDAIQAIIDEFGIEK